MFYFFLVYVKSKSYNSTHEKIKIKDRPIGQNKHMICCFNKIQFFATLVITK